jgi:hypothetical protein
MRGVHFGASSRLARRSDEPTPAFPFLLAQREGEGRVRGLPALCAKTEQLKDNTVTLSMQDRVRSSDRTISQLPDSSVPSLQGLVLEYRVLTKECPCITMLKN